MNEKYKCHYSMVDRENDNLMESQIYKDKDKDWYYVDEKCNKCESGTTTVGNNDKKNIYQRSQIQSINFRDIMQYHNIG